MTNFFEGKSFVLPSQAREDLAAGLKQVKAVRSLEFELKGEALNDAKEFAKTLLALRRQGTKISHQFSIKLDFPRSLSREKALKLVEGMPKPVNGSVRVRVQFDEGETE